jgi:hypothetical protein
MKTVHDIHIALKYVCYRYYLIRGSFRMFIFVIIIVLIDHNVV